MLQHFITSSSYLPRHWTISMEKYSTALMYLCSLSPLLQNSQTPLECNCLHQTDSQKHNTLVSYLGATLSVLTHTNIHTYINEMKYINYKLLRLSANLVYSSKSPRAIN